MSLIELYEKLVSTTNGHALLSAFLRENIIYIQQEYKLFEELYPNQSASFEFVQWVGAIQCRAVCKAISANFENIQTIKPFTQALQAFYQVIGVMSSHEVLYDVVNYGQAGLWRMISDPSVLRISDGMMQQYFSEKIIHIPSENKYIIIKIALKFMLTLVKDSDILQQAIPNFYVKIKDIVKFIFCFYPKAGVFIFPNINSVWLIDLRNNQYLDEAIIFKIKAIFLYCCDFSLERYLQEFSSSTLEKDNRLPAIQEIGL